MKTHVIKPTFHMSKEEKKPTLYIYIYIYIYIYRCQFLFIHHIYVYIFYSICNIFVDYIHKEIYYSLRFKISIFKKKIFLKRYILYFQYILLDNNFEL